MLNNPEIFDHPLIAYHPRQSDDKRILCNESARQVLSLPVNSLEEVCHEPPDVPSLCEKWKNSLDDLPPQKEGYPDAHVKHIMIDKYISGRRSYSVWGTVLSSCLPCSEGETHEAPCYMFVLNRSLPEKVNLLGDFRRRKSIGRKREDMRPPQEKERNTETGKKTVISPADLVLLMKLAEVGRKEAAENKGESEDGSHPSSQAESDTIMRLEKTENRKAGRHRRWPYAGLRRGKAGLPVRR